MKRLWSAEELLEGWTVSESDLQRRPDKLPSGRLGFVAQLAFFRVYARFPEQRSEFAAAVLTHLAEQIGVSPSVVDDYEWAGRTGRRHRETIREMLGILPFDLVAEAEFRIWLMTDALPKQPNSETLQERVTEWLRRTKFDRPGEYRFERIIRSCMHAHDEGVFQQVHSRLDDDARKRLDELLADGTGFDLLRADPGRVGLESLLDEVEKLKRLRGLLLPADITKPFHPELVKRLRRRAATESA